MGGLSLPLKWDCHSNEPCCAISVSCPCNLSTRGSFATAGLLSAAPFFVARDTGLATGTCACAIVSASRRLLSSCTWHYTVHRKLGGKAKLARLRKRLRKHGLRLMLDFVANHTALDHPWVEEHPEYYVPGTESDLARAPQNYP